jgi:aminoglycoside/choline kinase family phosphotransferase
MDSSYEKNSLKNFVKISNWLTKKGYSAPNIFYKELSKGFCLLEDFGDTKFSNLKNNNIKERYELTIQLLKSLSKKKPPHFLNNYSKLIFKKELNLFIDWYLFYNKKKLELQLHYGTEYGTLFFLKLIITIKNQ